MKHISIIGLGAVGSIYAYRLSEYLGSNNVRVIVNQNRKERYEQKGIFLNNNRVDFYYVLPTEEVEAADLVIVATKNHHLTQAIEDIRLHVGENTTIMSLLNGIDSEDLLSKAFGKEKVLYAFTTALDSTRTDNHIDFSTEGIIFFGEKSNKTTSRIEAIKHLFDQAKITYQVPDHIERELWAKFMVNVSINTVSAITRGTYGECSSIPSLRNLITDAQKEVIALAHKVGIVGLDDSYIDHYQKVFASLEYGGKTSMLQDIEASRPTENAFFCLRAASLAQEVGLEVPTIAMLGRVAQGCEEVLLSRGEKDRPTQ
ncbi:MAG: ketopantoate reductase family protein [Sphaerochaetaceae bacterium]|jgi:2-dehydropantoate 2-reductase